MTTLDGLNLTEAAARMRADREKVIETKSVELDSSEIDLLRAQFHETCELLAIEIAALKSVIVEIGAAAERELNPQMIYAAIGELAIGELALRSRHRFCRSRQLYHNRSRCWSRFC